MFFYYAVAEKVVTEEEDFGDSLYIILEGRLEYAVKVMSPFPCCGCCGCCSYSLFIKNWRYKLPIQGLYTRPRFVERNHLRASTGSIHYFKPTPITPQGQQTKASGYLSLVVLYLSAS